MTRKCLKQFGAWPLLIPGLNTLEIKKLYNNLQNYEENNYKVLFDNSPVMYNKSTIKLKLKFRHVAYA